MELVETHYISQLFCGLNYDDINGLLQKQKTHTSDLIFQCGPFLNPICQPAPERLNNTKDEDGAFSPFLWTGAIFVIAWFMLT